MAMIHGKRKRSSSPRYAKRMRTSSRAFRVPRPIQSLRNSGSYTVSRTCGSFGNSIEAGGGGWTTSTISGTDIIGVLFNGSGFQIYNPSAPSQQNTFGFNNEPLFESFDQFKINYVRLKMYCSNNTSNVSSVTTSNPLFYSCVDFDGSSATLLGTVAGLEQLLEYEDSMTHQAGTSTDRAVINRGFRPRCQSQLVQVLGSAVGTSGSGPAVSNQYVSCLTPGLPFYGMLIGTDGFGVGASATQLVRFVVEINCTFKGARG